MIEKVAIFLSSGVLYGRLRVHSVLMVKVILDRVESLRTNERHHMTRYVQEREEIEGSFRARTYTCFVRQHASVSHQTQKLKQESIIGK